MLSSFDKLCSNMSKFQIRETRKYLKSFYVQQPNQSQTNNVSEGGEEGEAMHTNEDHPYQSPTLTADQQQQIEKDLALMTWKWVYPYEYKDSFFSSLTEEDISEIYCTQIQRVFNHFNITDLGDYQPTQEFWPKFLILFIVTYNYTS